MLEAIPSERSPTQEAKKVYLVLLKALQEMTESPGDFGDRC
jgi:hypothetical protein